MYEEVERLSNMVDVFSNAVFAGHDTARAHVNSQWLWLYSPHLEQIHLVKIPPWIRDWGKEACATPTLAEELFSTDGCWGWIISFLQKYSPWETTNAIADGSVPMHMQVALSGCIKVDGLGVDLIKLYAGMKSSENTKWIKNNGQSFC